MNKDYCFTFQQHDLDYEPQLPNLQNQLTTNKIETNSSAIYEVVPNEEDVEGVEERQQCSRGYYFNAPKIPNEGMANKNKLRLNLNTEQISLKSQNNKLLTQTTANNEIIRKFTINKSMAEHATTTTTTKRQAVISKNLKKEHNKFNGINFKIAPLNNNNNNNNNNKDDEQQPQQQQPTDFPEIVLTSYETATANSNQSKLTSKKCSVKFQGVNQSIATTAANDKLEDSLTTDCEDSSELTSLPGNSTSPESILDNILSAASSVSVRNSSSFSSVGSDMTQLGPKEVKKATNTASSMPQVVILHANELEAVEQKKVHETLEKNNMQLHMPSMINWPKKKSLLLDTSPKSRLTVAPQLTPTSNNSGSSTRSQRSRTPSPSASFLMQASVEASIYPDELKCKICLKVLKDPRTLNCLHSFCFQCLVNENFKKDSSIPFWSQPTETVDDWKVTNRSNGSQRSASPDLTQRSGSDNSNNSPSKSKVPTLNFMRKKSLDKTLLKTKSESSFTVKPQTQIVDTRPKYIHCKICKFATELPLAGLRQLPQNFVLLRKIEDCRLKAGTDVVSKVYCNLCFEEISATYHCLSCNCNLCTLCKDAHERQKSTANHQIKNIMDVRRAKKQQLNQLEDNNKFLLKCNLHAGFDIKAFCTTCLQVACSDCVLLLHKAHKIETVPQAVERYTKLLRESAENTRPLCTYAEHSIERLNEIAKGINQKCDNIQAEVENFMRQYYEAVEVHRKTMLQQVNRARENKVEMILEQQMDLEKRITEAMDAIRFTQDLTDTASDVEILMFLGVLLKRFEYCQQFKTPVDPKVSDSLHFLPKIRAPSAKNQNDIPLYGIITMQTVEPALCTLQTEGISQLRLHKKVELKLISRDADNTELCHGGLNIQALLKYKEYNAKFLPVEVSDNRDGTYIISFTPDSKGTLILTVTIDDKPIKGTPFSILVRTVRPHTGIYHCCAFCSSKGSKLAKCSCEGRMPGYEGCGHGHAGHPGRRHWSCCGNILENSECSVANKLLNP